MRPRTRQCYKLQVARPSLQISGPEDGNYEGRTTAYTCHIKSSFQAFLCFSTFSILHMKSSAVEGPNSLANLDETSFLRLHSLQKHASKAYMYTKVQASHNCDTTVN